MFALANASVSTRHVTRGCGVWCHVTLCRVRLGRFASPEGDHLTLLSVLEAFASEAADARWCRERFVNYRSLKLAQARARAPLARASAA